MEGFSSATGTWFTEVFAAPTPAQAQTWQTVSRGDHALVIAPTGSGKTLAAFLWALDRLATEPTPVKQRRCRVLYVSPLKALAVDVERNLAAPLTGIQRTAQRLGTESPQITVGVRSGDTPAAERRRLITTPPDILITTPESLFLLLTSAGREILSSVETVIVDEVHAIAGTKRGAHLALSLERLSELCRLDPETGEVHPERDPQRIGLSATVRPAERVARFLGGDRSVTVVAPEAAKTWELEIVVPLADMTQLEAPPADRGGSPEAGEEDPASRSIWPHVTERILDLIEANTSTIVFANSRRVAERLTTRLNELHAERLGVEVDDEHEPPAAIIAQSGSSHATPEGAPIIARAHHGSVSKEQRAQTEDALKSGRLRCVVATSSLELGIDMGAVDLVIQVASPPSVASGLQRVGRAGHQVGAVSRGVVFPQYRGDLVESAVVLDRMRAGAIEEVVELRNPIDVLAQHLVSMCALEPRQVESTYAMVRACAAYAELPLSVFEAVLDMLSGRYPSEDFAELRPRLVWHRDTGQLEGRPGAQRLAVTSGGTIPDRGLFGVHLVAGEEDKSVPASRRASRRVGELDEEMVYESRVGDVITLGTSTWRIEDITHDQVLVSPAPGLPGRLPFWKGDAPARPAELGQALGLFTREIAALPPDRARERLTGTGLDAWAADNLIAYLDDQREATEWLPSDDVIVVERFRDELGDWQVCVHCQLGSGVLAPWALAIERSARERYGVEVQATAGNDGIVLRIPDTSDTAPGADLVVIDTDDLRTMITDEVAGSALFAARFRECAARALLLPRRDPNSRSPLWQQRMRAAQLLSVASKFPDFPIILETMRECLNDVFDLEQLITVQQAIAARRIRVVEVETPRPSPYARSLLFGYIGEFVYSEDVPLAERRSAALTLDTALLAELLGGDQLRQILDPGVIAQVEADLQALSEERRRSTTEELFDLIRTGGPYDLGELTARWSGDDPPEGGLRQLAAAKRIAPVRIAGIERWAVAEDLPRLRDALGIPIPAGMAVPDAPPDPLTDLVVRWARTHGPFTSAQLAERYGLGTSVVDRVLGELVRLGSVVRAEFLTELVGQQYCHARVLAVIKRRTLAALRAEVEPCDPSTLGRFLPRWQSVAAHGARPDGRGVDGVYAAIEQLAGLRLPVGALESLILPARVRDYSPAWLDELITSGEVQWLGSGSLGESDGWVQLVPHGMEPPPLDPQAPTLSGTAHELLATLAIGGGWFLDDLLPSLSSGDGMRADAESALWELVWAGHVTCDTFAPLRQRLAGAGRPGRRRPAGRARPRSRTMRSGARPARRPGRPTSATGRWSAVRRTETSPTERLAEDVLGLLDRYGVLTRGSVMAEELEGGFGVAYKALARLEETGSCRRGYFVAGLGAAQFALPGAVDQLRDLDQPGQGEVHVLAACDPANPYGAALPWPVREGHRPGRSSGAVVVLVDGELVLYLERGGKSLLTFAGPGGDDTVPGGRDRTATAIAALAETLARAPLPTVTIERIDGDDAFSHPVRETVVESGFTMVPQGLRLRR